MFILSLRKAVITSIYSISKLYIVVMATKIRHISILTILTMISK